MEDFMAEKTVEEKLERIYDGLAYHMYELAHFLHQNEKDPYFETEEGKDFKNNMMEMLGAHASCAMTYIMKKLKK